MPARVKNSSSKSPVSKEKAEKPKDSGEPKRSTRSQGPAKIVQDPNSKDTQEAIDLLDKPAKKPAAKKQDLDLFITFSNQRSATKTEKKTCPEKGSHRKEILRLHHH